MIENYSDRYFIDVANLVKSFHDEAVGEYDGFDIDAVIGTIKAGDPQNAFLLILDGACRGILYGVRTQSPISGQTIYQEIIWYVHKAFRLHGVRLLQEAQKILKSQGVSIMIMAVLENSKTEKLKSFYERLGFKLTESHYVRAL